MYISGWREERNDAGVRLVYQRRFVSRRPPSDLPPFQRISFFLEAGEDRDGGWTYASPPCVRVVRACVLGWTGGRIIAVRVGVLRSR